MNELQIIDQRELLGKDFKIYGNYENPYFLAKDVAKWIEHSQTDAMIKTVDKNEKLTLTLFSSGQNREMWFLTEDGLYEVLMQSRKPIAKQFKAKVKEILKDIRKHGMYATSQTIDNLLNNPDTMINILTRYKEEKERSAKLEQIIEAQKPQVIFAESVTVSKDTVLVAELAKILKQKGKDIGQNRLFDWLRSNGYLIKRKGADYNEPTQYSMELGLFEVKKTAVTHSDGRVTTNITPRVTGKGQVYFINKFLQGNPQTDGDAQ